MRMSRYTLRVRGPQGEHLLYNTANGAFVQVGSAVIEALEQACAQASSNGPSPESDAPAMLEQLGIATQLAPDEEFEQQQALFDANRADASALTLSFIPTYACNFRCPYCYEIGHNKVKGVMDERTMDAIMSFVRFKHEQDGFTSLSVQWYGGDPSLALREVELLTARLVSWCDQVGVTYDAMMLTNANVIDEDAADLVARCRIRSVMLTIDGPEELHNRRRVAANGSNSYQRTLSASRLLRERGVNSFANMNADKVNFQHYAKLRDELYAEEGIVLSAGKLNDYGHFFGQPPFCSPDFDLYTHEEFFEASFAEFQKAPHTAAELREMLRPIRRFCTGQLDNYFIIDLLGDVYCCDGWVGDTSHVTFNLFDDRSTWQLHDVSFDPTRDDKCAACELLPVCLGSCIWERSLSGMPCHPFKTTIDGYLRVYFECIEAERVSPDSTPLADDAVRVLADPFPQNELG